MDALTYLATKYDLNLAAQRMPIEIPNTDRVTLARLLFLLGYTTGAEIGVERGMYADVLCRENPGVRLFCVDAWKAYRGYRDHVSQEKLDRFYLEAQERLMPYKGVSLIREFSVDAAKAFPDGSLDFVYLDAAHDLRSVINDLAAWVPKVRPGGIVAGHDFVKAKWPSLMHVPQAVYAWTDAYAIAPWFVLGRREKRNDEKRDDGRSWFWVQPEPRSAKSATPIRH